MAADPGDKATPQGWIINPVSPSEIDDELHVPYPMFAMVNGKRPILGTVQSSMQFAPMAKAIPTEWGSSVLIWIAGKSAAEKTLIFAQRREPPQQLGPADDVLKPTDSRWIKRQEPWPAVIRSQPKMTPIFGAGGNYMGMHITPIDEVPAATLWTDVYVEEWWTTKAWPRELLKNTQMMPGVFSWRFPLGFSGKIRALHDELTTPPVTGISKINGQAVSTNANVPGFRFPATIPTYRTTRVRDRQVRVNGHWHRIRETSHDPGQLPPAAIQTTS